MQFLLDVTEYAFFAFCMSFHLCQLTCLGINDVSMQVDVVGDKGMMADGVYCIAYGILGIMESFQPVVKVDATESDGVNDVLAYPTFHH